MAKLFDLLSENSDNEKVISSLKKIAKTARNTSFAQKNPLRQAAIPDTGIFDFVAIDVETTGLDHKTDRVIEIGAIKFSDGKPHEEFSTLINPGRPLPPGITQLTGITDGDLSGAPVFSLIAGDLQNFIAGLPLCGHQIEFDIHFINEEFKRIGKPKLSAPEIDTALLSRIIVPSNSRFSLKHVSQSLGIGLENAHRALADARASGEVAVALIFKIDSIDPSVRLAMARFAPGSIVKTLLFKSLERGRASGDIRPIGAAQKPPKKLSAISPQAMVSLDMVRRLFSANGKLSKIMRGFIERPSQTRMAQCVAEAFNTGTFLVAEAGTGTGKSLAYLLPAAFFAVSNNVRVLVSTHTRNLQDQLMSKDLPVVKKSVGEELRFSVLKGRSNYLCVHRYKRLLSGELADLSYRERMGLLPLIRWAQETKTGDIEEQSQFNIRWFSRIWRQLCADAHLCKGKQCPDFGACFLQNARQRALGSHVVIINHSLFFSEVCSESSFLGTLGPIIFDEAHHIESCGHRHLRVEVDTNRFTLFLDNLANFDKEVKKLGNPGEAAPSSADLKAMIKRVRQSITGFLEDCNAWAYKQGAGGATEYHYEFTHDSFSGLASRLSVLTSLADLQDLLYHVLQSFASDEPAAGAGEKPALPAARLLSDRASQLKADLDYVSGAVTDGHVFWLEGNSKKGWVKLCGVALDVGSLLSSMWEKNGSACVFTSATLSISRSMEYFKQKAGLTGPNEAKTRCETFESPFSPKQTFRGAIRGAPACDMPEYPDYVAGVIAALMRGFHKNILVLFTANAMLEAVYSRCKERLADTEHTLLAQGITGNRQAVLDEFKNSNRAVLLGADSFWEGVDAPGKACEIVIIPRLPFQVPTHPLTKALAEKSEKENGESFFSFTVPEAIIRFRQGTGRLIRTPDDRGALLVLDNRILTKNYGKRFRDSLDGELMPFATIEDAMTALREFFSGCGAAASAVTYVPLEEPS
jgi:predicted DnaQ family exonuclease/DinG family helicase